MQRYAFTKTDIEFLTPLERLFQSWVCRRANELCGNYEDVLRAPNIPVGGVIVNGRSICIVPGRVMDYHPARLDGTATREEQATAAAIEEGFHTFLEHGRGMFQGERWLAGKGLPRLFKDRSVLIPG